MLSLQQHVLEYALDRAEVWLNILISTFPPLSEATYKYNETRYSVDVSLTYSLLWYMYIINV